MRRTLAAIGTFFMAMLRFDFNVTTATFQNRSRTIGRTIWYELYALPIFVFLGWLISPIFHLFYAVFVGGMLAYQMWCVSVMYGLAVLNLQFAGITVKALHKLLAVANILPAAINDKADQIKAELERILTSETGDLAAGMDAFAKAVIGILKIPAAMTETILNGLDQFVTDVQTQIAAVPDGIKRRAQEQVGPVIYKLMSLQWWIFVISLLFWLLPWWRNPTAAIFSIFGGVLVLLLLPSNKKPETNLSRFNKWVILATLAGLTLAYFGVSVFPRPEVITLFCALPVAVILPQIIGIRMTVSVVVLAIGIWGLAMPEHWVRLGIQGEDSNHTVPRYYRAVHVGGMPKFYRTRPVNPAKQVGSSWWSPVSQYDFRPKRNWRNLSDEAIDINTVLFRLETGAEKDVSGGLWIKVVRTNLDGLPSDETPFYVPMRGDFIQEIPAPGTPVQLVRTYYGHEDKGRIDSNEGLHFARFCRQKWGWNFHQAIWSGYPQPITAEFNLPIRGPFRIGSSFRAPVGNYKHVGIDLVSRTRAIVDTVYASFDGVIDGLALNECPAVMIRHAVPETPDTVWTYYGNLATIAAGTPSGERLRSGVRVKKGDPLGTILASSGYMPYEAAHLHFSVLRREPSDNKVRSVYAVDPLEALQMLGDPILVSADSVEIRPYVLKPVSTDSSNFYYVPANLPVCVFPGWAEAGADVEIRVVGGQHFPDHEYNSSLNTATSCRGTERFPVDIDKYQIPVDGSRYSALVAGVNGLQVAWGDDETLALHAEEAGLVHIGFNEPVCRDTNFLVNADGSPVYVDFTANNTGGYIVEMHIYNPARGGTLAATGGN